MAAGGLLLHARIHPLSKDALNAFAIGFGLFDTLVLPGLFLFRRGVPWAYVINVTSVVVGVVTMTWYSATHWTAPVTLMNLLLLSTLGDSLILLAKLPLAHVLLRAWREQDGKGAA
jgi:hypothetical protein